MDSPLILNDAAGANALRQAEIARVRVLEDPLYGDRKTDFRRALVEEIGAGEVVLDAGKSMRDWFDPLAAKARLVHTLDLNVFDDYPDLVADLCQPIPETYHATYDVVIALGTLNCVYDPQAMVDNIHRLLKPGGRTYLYAPFLYQYSAPRDRSFQDFYRFSLDAVAYLLRAFAEVEARPIRGQYSTIANLLPSWKQRVEPRFGVALNRLLDRLADPRRSQLNASGYLVKAVKSVEGSR